MTSSGVLLQFADDKESPYEISDEQTKGEILACFPTIAELVRNTIVKPTDDNKGDVIPLPGVATKETFAIVLEVCRQFKPRDSDRQSAWLNEDVPYTHGLHERMENFLLEYSEQKLRDVARAAEYLGFHHLFTIVSLHVQGLVFSKRNDFNARFPTTTRESEEF